MVVPFLVGCLWRTPDTYHLAGIKRGTATSNFHVHRDNLSVHVLQVTEDPGGFGAAVPGQTSALVNVVIRGDDLTMGSDEASRDVRLPAQAVGRVLQVVSRRTGAQCEPDHAASRFWWSRKVRTMRAKTAATFGVTWGASSAMNRIGSRWSEPDDGRPPTVPRGASAIGGFAFMSGASFAAHGALRALLFQKQLLDEVQEAGSNDEPTASDFDALDPLGHDQLIGPRPAHPEDVGHLFYREQQLGVHLLRVSFIGQGGASTLCSGLGHGCACSGPGSAQSGCPGAGGRACRIGPARTRPVWLKFSQTHVKPPADRWRSGAGAGGRDDRRGARRAGPLRSRPCRGLSSRRAQRRRRP